MSRHKTTLQDLWRKGARPGSTLVFLFLLVTSFVVVKSQSMHVRGGSWLAEAILPGGQVRINFGPGHWDLVRVDGRLIVVDLDKQSADMFSKVAANAPNDAFSCDVRVLNSDRGLYALTERREGVSISVTTIGASPVPDEVVSEVVSLVADECARSGRPWHAQEVRAGGGLRVRPIWLGYLHNFSASVAFVGFALSLRWIPDWIHNLARARRDTRRAKGLCGTCGYDLGGELGGVCSECGKRNVPGT